MKQINFDMPTLDRNLSSAGAARLDFIFTQEKNRKD